MQPFHSFEVEGDRPFFPALGRWATLCAAVCRRLLFGFLLLNNGFLPSRRWPDIGYVEDILYLYSSAYRATSWSRAAHRPVRG